MIELYNDKGYINVPAIAERPTWLKVLIGARQVGKTYGVLKYHLDNDIPFVFLRRTTEEIKFIGNNAEMDPFKKFEPEYNTALKSAGGSYIVADFNEDGDIEKQRGVALSLPQIAHIRGFDGSSFLSVVLDEAVPEKGVRVLRTEGDSLLNAYTTIAGNRELDGKPPLILWLLANTNNINSPILEALNLTDDIIKMRAKGKEYFEHDGVSIFQGRSAAITEKRKQTALARQIKENSPFAEMAFNNEWGYDTSPIVKVQSLKGMTPLCGFGDGLYFWEGSTGIYCCRAAHKVEHYNDDNFSKGQFIGNYQWLVRWYAEKLVTFSDIRQLALFQQMFDIVF